MIIKKYNDVSFKKAFGLIEGLVLLFILGVTVVTFYSVFVVGTRYIIDAKNRLGAVAVANEKMEIIRNLDYDDIGTTEGGAINGAIPQDQDVVENASTYHVRTVVGYVEDSLDGVYPEDVAWEDYKTVTVTVSWNSSSSGSVVLTARFVPPGLEVAHPGDGILKINVFSDQPGGTGIAGSSVHVVNSATGLDTTVPTDLTGSVTLMGDRITESVQAYEITVSKSGHETVQTLPPYPETGYNPVDVHASVVAGAINVANIVQNQLSQLEIKTVDFLDRAIPNIGFHIVGGRRLGNQAALPYDPVFNVDSDFETDISGERDLGNVSPGQYTFSLDPSETGYELIGTSSENPVSISSGQEVEFAVILADKNMTSILVKAVRSDDSTPIAGATVRLSNAGGYDVTQTSSSTGNTFFPETEEPFLPGDYSLSVSADGYSSHNSTVTINQNELRVETVNMNLAL